MKKILVLFLMFIPLMASAEPVEIDGIYYNLVSKAQIAEVTRSNSSYYSGEVIIPLTVTYEEKIYNVTSIGNNAFSYCSGLTSVTIPNSVTSIGESAFDHCSSLTSVTIPNSVTSIGESAFNFCSSLTSVTIPNSVTSIEKNAFYGCSSLTSVHISDLEAWCKIYFGTFNSNPLNNAHHLYLKGEEITNLVIPNSMTYIGKYVFSGGIGLTSVIIPNSVTSIGNNAFSYCSGLTSVTIPNSVTSIGESAFSYCSSLNSVTIPNSVISIKHSAFSSCKGLTSVTIPNSVTTIDGYWSHEGAFENCTGLTSVTIPNSVFSIGERAFRSCSNLTSVTIGSGVCYIKENAFSQCPGLTDVYCYAENVPSTDGNAFKDSYIEYVTLHVPKGCSNAYKTVASWNVFKDIVEMEDPSVRTVDVTTAGTLSTLISNDDKFSISDLTITGQLNGKDFALLRAMAGNDEKGKPTEGKLKKLDLSGATIVDGGTYLNLDNDHQYIELANGQKYYGVSDEAMTSIANTFGDYLFAGCKQLESIKTPTSLIEIGNNVFRESGLTSIDLNSGLTTLAPYAFWQSKLNSITIPNTVVHIGDKNSVDNPFAYIDNLKSITLEDGNTRYEMAAEGKLLIDTQNKAVVTALGNADIPEGFTWIGQNAFCSRPELVNFTIPNWVTQIGGNSFSQCENLESVVISNQMTTITNSAFTECPKLTSVTIPSSVTKIMYNALGNTGLTEVTIPASVNSIDGQAFAHNQNLTTVISYITTPFDIDDDVFAKGWDLSNTTYPETLKVPAGTKALYEAKTGWNKIANIVEMDADPVAEYTDEQGVKYSLNDDEKSYSVSDHTDACTGEVTILSSVNGCSVTSIGDYAFRGCSALTSITIPNSVTSIGNHAFQECSGLISVTIPNSVTSIGDYAFANCYYNLTSITIPNSVTSIGERAFWTCYRLTSVTIPNSVTSIGDYAFSGCNGLTSLSVEAGNTKYDSRENCNAIIETETNKLVCGTKNTIIPNSVTSIGESAFSGCSGLTSVTIPNSVTSIGKSAFENCSRLTSITIPNSVTSIGDGAFKGCSGLTSLSVEVGNTKYDSRENCNAIIETESNKLVCGTKNTIIPNSVTSIGEHAFYRCSGLTSITIPNSVTSIGDAAFVYCSGLTSMTIPNSVTYIDYEAFCYCSGLTSVTIPNSVTSIGDGAFFGCSSLTSVTVEAETPITISTSVFSNRENATLYVPAGSKATYQAADYWKEFNDIIEMEDPSVRTIDVETAGDLASKISSDDKYTITDLTITGQLNGTDFRLLREMSGNDYQGNLTEGKLSKLDLSGATIVAGGDYYLNTTTIHWTDNSQMVMNEPMQFSTNDNELGSYLFAGCKSLETIILPKNITTIGGNVFSHNSKLLSLEIPKTVSSIAFGVIQECENLSSLSVESGNQMYSSPEGSNAIIQTANMELVAGCKNTIIPSGTKIIDPYAFQHCISLTSILLPEGITQIGDFAFWGCNGLTDLNIPASVTQIGYMAFYGCSALNSIVVDSENSVYDSRNNCNALIETSSNTLLLGCKNTIIPDGISKIGENAFRPCDGLTSIEIPASVTSIGDNAFAYCHQLENVISNIEDPNTVVMGSTVFDRISDNAKLYVPAGCVDAYKAADCWKEFSSIEEIAVMEDPSVLTINVETAGDLSDLFSNYDVDPLTVTELTITGQLNGTDLRLIREMAGNDYLGKPTDGKLKKLDISGANIVEGGEKYLDTDQVTSSTGSPLPNIGENSFHFATQNNVLGSCLFAGCDKLEEIVLPNSITSIGDYVFWYCLNLQTLEIPKDVSSIGWRFINGSNNISNLTVAEGNQKFSSPENSNVLMQGTKLILGLNSSIIPDGTTIIGSEAFINCTGINDISVPEGVTTIEGGAFARSGLKSISFPSTLTTIENDAFAGCSNLTSFTLPKTVTHYGEGLGALKDCGNLTSISVEKDNPNYDSRDNCNAIIETGTNTLISGCKNTVIPASVTILGHQPFRGVTLSNYVIPNWITTIGEMAFWNANMTSVTIPSSVTYIGEYAFAYPTSLTTVTVESATPITIFENTFTDRSTIDLIVPAGSKATYQAADYWKEFKEIIEMEDPSVRTINVETAGTLSTKISNDEKFTIKELTITGPLNGTDLRLIREMAGNDEKGQPTEGKLSKLDISGANIVDGGTYMDLDDQYIELANGQKYYGVSDEPKTSIANTFGDYLFAGCQQLESIKTPTSLIEIGNNVFRESGLTSIDLNSGLTTLDPYAFWQSKLSSITIPKTVNHIGDKNSVDNPFAYIDNLKSITLESGNARYEMVAEGKLLIDNTNNAVVCALGNATIPEGITWIGNNAFCNRPELVNFTIPNWVTQIGGNSFSQCDNLESVVISDQMTTITNSAFTDCPRLKSVTIPSSVTKIMYNAFGNTGFTEITIPSSVTSIDGQAFAHNQNLTTVISYIETPFDIDDDVFAKGWDLSNTTYPDTLKVPYGTKALYEAKTGWNKIATIVEMGQPIVITITAKSYSRAYGEANPTFESDITGGTVTGIPEITCAATTTSGVGTYDIVITAGTITDTNVQYVNGTLTVTKAPLKITAGSYIKKQGEDNPEFGVTYEGFKNNESDAVLTTKPTVACDATKDSPVGTYDITVSDAVAANYEISYVAGTLTIEAAPEPEPEPTPMPEPKGTVFDLDTEDSSKEVKVTFVVKEIDSSGTPTVAVSDDKDASGSVSIPESVTHNGVEYKVTEISEGAFQNNTNLTEVKIPASITSIGPKAFAGCKNLQEITINIIVPINIAVISARAVTRTESSNPVFEGVDMDKCILYVPEGSVDAYKAAPGWNDFKNIVAIGSITTGIKGIEMTEGETFDVFNLNGQKVKSQATSLEGLQNGIYVVKGKKVMK